MVVMLRRGAGARRYDPSTGAEILRRHLGTGSVRDLEIFGEAGRQQVAAILDSGLYVWKPASDSVTRLSDPTDTDPARLFKVCAYRWAGRTWLASAYTDGYIATWDLDSPDAEATVQQAHDGPIWSLISTHAGDGEPIVVSGASATRSVMPGRGEIMMNVTGGEGPCGPSPMRIRRPASPSSAAG